MSQKKARVIAFYLPQFHAIPENDEWWGKGFTEWTNVRKAKPLFKGHDQPRVPSDLGYYNLLDSDVREAQASMAKKAGVEGFMYWHYWFGNGKRLLERPFNEVLESGTPDFPFCLGWANHSWYAKNWNSNDSSKDKLLIEQVYPGEEDIVNHFYAVLKAFKDSRYLLIDGKPIFMIYAPNLIPDIAKYLAIWRELAVKNELKGIYFVGQAGNNKDCAKIISLGFDGVCRAGIEDAINKIRGKYLNKILFKIRKHTNLKIIPLNKYKYSEIVDNLLVPEIDKRSNIFPSVIPNFDHTPRSGREGLVYIDSTPELFGQLLNKTIKLIEDKEFDKKIIFLRSWNEWAEGNYVEPDKKFGNDYLDTLKDEIIEK